MLFIGLDVHLRSSSMCILDRNGKRVKQIKVRGHCSKTIAELERLRQPFAVCYEASCGYGWLHDRLRKIAARMTARILHGPGAVTPRRPERLPIR